MYRWRNGRSLARSMHTRRHSSICAERQTHVVGFFFGPSKWSQSRSVAMYRWFYEEGVRIALGRQRVDFAGTVYRHCGSGQRPILVALGTALNDYLLSGLSIDCLEGLRKKPTNRWG